MNKGEKQTISIKEIFDEQIVEMVQIITEEMLEDGYLRDLSAEIPYYKELFDQGKDIAKKVFAQMVEENKKREFDNFCVVLLKCMTFMGMGAVQLFNKGFNPNSLYDKIIGERGFLYFDDYVLDLFNMPYSSPKGLTFCNDFISYSTWLLDNYVADAANEREEMELLTKCMLAMYTIGIIYGHSEMK